MNSKNLIPKTCCGHVFCLELQQGGVLTFCKLYMLLFLSGSIGLEGCRRYITERVHVPLYI